jgi:hypothetical protein
MDRYTMMVALSGQICGTILLISLIGMWVNRRKGSAALPPDSVKGIEMRLSEMQQSLDAVAVEVERISEAQRFATKLLVERGVASMDEANGVRQPVRGSSSR